MDRDILLLNLDVTELKESLYQTLHIVEKELNHFPLEGHTFPMFTIQLIDKLLPLGCENLLITYKKAPSSKRHSRRNAQLYYDPNGEKNLPERVSDKLVIILLKLCYGSDAACERVIESILQHMDSHYECTNMYLILLRLMLYCDRVRTILKEIEASSIVAGLLEKACEQPVCINQLNSTTRHKHSRKSSDFGPMIKLPVSTANIPPEYRTALNKTFMSENDSFLMEMPTVHGHTVSSRAIRRAGKDRVEEPVQKNPLVPLLNLPAINQESSRSSRRIEPQRSTSTRSARITAFSGSWGEHLPSPITTSPYSKETPKPFSTQAFDFDTSFIVEENTNPVEFLTAHEKLRNLAIQLGEACLTADLTGLIAQKRDHELEREAKLAAFPGKQKLEAKKEKFEKEVSKPKPSLRLRSHSLTSLTSPKARNKIENENLPDIGHKNSTQVYMLRTAMLTLLNHLLELYEPNDLQFVRSPVNILFGHILSSDFNHTLSIQQLKAQETGEFSDDEEDLYEEEICYAGDNKEKETTGMDLLKFRYMKEEASNVPANTVPGHSPRGAKPMKPGIVYEEREEEISMSQDHSSFMIGNESSELELGCYQVWTKRVSDLLIPEHIAIFSILSLYSQYTESIHRQAVTPQITQTILSTSTSQFYDAMSQSPKKSKGRSPNISMAISWMMEEMPHSAKETVLWIHGIGWSEIISKSSLRKKSDILLYRMSRRVQWVLESFTGVSLYENLSDVLNLIARYLRICSSRVSFLQTIDLMFESLLNIKKTILELSDFPCSRPPSPTANLSNVKGLCKSYLQVVTQLLLQAQTIEACKLLSDVYISNESWNDCLRHFTMSVMGDNIRQEARCVIKYYSAVAIFCRRVVNELNLERKTVELSSNERAWKGTIRKALSSLIWLTSPSKGLIPRFLHRYSPNLKPNDLNPYSPLPRNLHITRVVLELLCNLFWFSPRFSSFRNEEHALFYIRMHYISFLKLYTNNKPKCPVEEPSLNATVGNNQSISSLIDNNTNGDYLRASLLLCKLHLKCLYTYARNRTPDITRKFYQFRILEFLTREIDLEYDIILRRERFIELHRAERQRVTSKYKQATAKKESIDKIKEDVKSENKSFKPPPLKLPNLEGGKDKPKIPALKLSLSTIKEESRDSPSPLNKPMIPSLKINLLATESREAKELKEETKDCPPPVFKPPIPALKINFLTQDPERKEQEKREFVKAIEQEVEKQEKENYVLTRIQNSLDGTKKFQLCLDLTKNQGKEDPANSTEVLKENEFYEQERRQREIYSDEELHVYILSLIFCLLLTPTRGTLEELYCSQYPINNGKPNVLFLLHRHLNHSSNQHILPRLVKIVGHIVPPLAGQRLLKLLCAQFFDGTIYTDWSKLATGAYGTVYECKTGLSEPTTVAIKKMPVPRSIYDRCVLHDIFTEIACLEEFRLERCITDLYDYGVDENDYYIIMKRYPTSLKEWRTNLSSKMEDNLLLFLSIYREILKSVQIIHDHMVTHYDLKCDNILLDEPLEDCRVTIGDFGESRMFLSSKDELCLRNKGTEYIKSPEMLVLTIAVRKEHDKYDRRKKVGTTRTSDIWSLGCLLYELLTGEFLFYHEDWAYFFNRCISPNEELLDSENISKISNNVYIVDFLRYMLVRDPQHRPSIENVLTRFEHLHALLVSVPSIPMRPSSNYTLPSFNALESVISQCTSLMSAPAHLREVSDKPSPSLLRITHDIYLCSNLYFKESFNRLLSLGISHIVHSGADENILRRFQNILIGPTPLQSIAGLLDFLRQAHITKGKIAFVEGGELQIREVLLMALSDLFKTNCFETWSLVRSQVLFFSIPHECLVKLSSWTLQKNKIKHYMSRFPQYQCLCGCVSVVLKRHLADPKYQITKNCNCARQYRNVDTSECPSPGCGDFLSALKDMHAIKFDHLTWGFAERDDFLIGPMSTNKLQQQIILNSLNIDSNAELYKVIEKRPWRSGTEHWALYKCKVCHIWMFAISHDECRVAYLMNFSSNRLDEGILTGGKTLSVPVLSRIKI